MLKFPSIPAAILTGALGMPIFMWGAKYIEQNLGSGLLLFLWSLIGFVVPVIVATADLRYIRDRIRVERYLLGKIRALWTPHRDYMSFFVPAWTRMAVLFLSAVISIILLGLIGMR